MNRKWEKTGRGQFVSPERILSEQTYERDGKWFCTVRVLLDSGKHKDATFEWDAVSSRANVVGSGHDIPHQIFITMRNRAKDAFAFAISESRKQRTKRA